MDLPRHGLVVFTWGNASELDPGTGLFVIKPSGVDYDDLAPESMVVCDLEGRVVEGELNPSSDTATHAAIYRAWGERVRGVGHTHSAWAVSWARDITDTSNAVRSSVRSPTCLVYPRLWSRPLRRTRSPTSRPPHRWARLPQAMQGR